MEVTYWNERNSPCHCIDFRWKCPEDPDITGAEANTFIFDKSVCCLGFKLSGDIWDSDIPFYKHFSSLQTSSVLFSLYLLIDSFVAIWLMDPILCKQRHQIIASGAKRRFPHRAGRGSRPLCSKGYINMAGICFLTPTSEPAALLTGCWERLRLQSDHVQDLSLQWKYHCNNTCILMYIHLVMYKRLSFKRHRMRLCLLNFYI